MKQLPSVAVVGRPNVGKSTLFNRITRGRRAIVHPAPGVTRDIQKASADWNGVPFELTDTGGLFSGVDDALISEVERRAIEEARESDALVFVVDGQTGLTPGDELVADKVRETGAPVILAVNKTEKGSARGSAGDFFRLGFDNVYEISALHGEGIGDLLDDLVALLPRLDKEELAPELRLAVIGMPNVGKSSLVNALVGAEANIVDERPGTTRDSIDVSIRWHGHRVTLVDTAGIKRKSRTKDGINAISALKSLESIERSDVTVLMLDASRGIDNQDVKVASYAHKAGAGVLVCYNKWDLVDKDDKTYAEYEKRLRGRMSFLSYAPVIFISALTHQRIGKVFELAWRIKEQRERRLSTSEFNQFIGELIARHPPPFFGGGTGKVYYGTQVEVTPPTFSLFVNKSRYFGRNYLRFLNNQIRKTFGFEGTVIRIKLVEKSRQQADRDRRKVQR